MDIESISLVRTKTGEMFIGQLDTLDGKVELKEAYMLQVVPTSNNSFNIMMLPVFMPLLKEATDLELTGAIMAITKPTPDLQSQYVAAITNIVLAPNPMGQSAQQLIKR